MTRMLAWLSATVVIGALAGCVDVGTLSRELNTGMTEEQVTSKLGYPPQSVSMTMCGTETPEPWRCKEYKYEGIGRLNIYFQQADDGMWRVNSWDAR